VGEIKALLLLRNVPNILQIREFFFNFGDPNGAPLALVTELMQGEDLDKWIKDQAATQAGLTELTASEVCLGLLNAVQHMHSRNIVHRDLKVGNMRITVGLTRG
jgi:serine/threonine protein kinase